MELVSKLARRGTVIVPVALLVVIAIGYAYVAGLPSEGQEELLYFVQDYLPIVMFGTLAVLLFSGFPVAFILGPGHEETTVHDLVAESCRQAPVAW